MANCCICGRNIISNTNSSILGKNACNTCADKMKMLENMESNSVQSNESAINYFYNNICATDIEIKAELMKFLNEKMAKNKQRKESKSTSGTSYSSYGSYNRWIVFVAFLTWFAFVIIIISGIVGGIIVGGFLGFLTFLGSILGAFIYIAPMMMMVEMAKQVSDIKYMISKK